MSYTKFLVRSRDFIVFKKKDIMLPGSILLFTNELETFEDIHFEKGFCHKV